MADGNLDQMTENVPREYARVSFTLEEDEEDDGDDDTKKHDRGSTLPDSSAGNQLGNKRTRAGRATAITEKLAKEESIKKDQSVLLDKNLEALI